MKTKPELRQMLEFIDKDTKTAIIAVYFMFKKLSKDMEDIINTNQTSRNEKYVWNEKYWLGLTPH